MSLNIGDIKMIEKGHEIIPVICVGADTICDASGTLSAIPSEVILHDAPIPLEIEQAFLKVQQKYQDLCEANLALEKEKQKGTVNHIDLEYYSSRVRGREKALKAALAEVQYGNSLYASAYSPTVAVNVANYIAKLLEQY